MTRSVAVSPTAPKQHRFHYLDALRGLAALLVIMRHAPVVFSHALKSNNSYLAVDFFFCLSGFVIAFSYGQRLMGSLTLKNFLVARVIRLYPIAAIGTLLGVAEVLAKAHLHGHLELPVLARETILSLFLFPSFHDSLFPLDGVLWTLFFELAANIFYAALVRARMAGIAIVTALSFGSLVMLTVERELLGTIDLGGDFQYAYVGLTRVFCSFFLGVLTFHLYRWHTHGKAVGRRSIVAAPLLTGVFLLVLCGPAALTNIAPVNLFVVACLFPFIVYSGAQVVLEGDGWTDICAFLGTISYPVYLLHPSLLWLLATPRLKAYGEAHSSTATWIMLGATVLLVVLCWTVAEFYDTPVRRMLTRVYLAHELATKTRTKAEEPAPLRS